MSGRVTVVSSRSSRARGPIGVLVAVLALGACASPEADSSGAAPSTPAARPSRGGSNSEVNPEHVPGQSVTAVPRLPGGSPLAEAGGRRGSARLPLKGGVRPGPLSVMVTCQGGGTLRVTLVSSGDLSFPLKCGAGSSSSTYNEIHLKRRRATASVHVDAPSRIRWAIAVGQ